MKKILLSLLLFFLILYSFAQTSGLQNLGEQLSNHPQQDTSYVNHLNDFLHKTNGLSLQQADSIASVELSIAKRLNYTGGIMQALVNLSFTKRSLGNNQESIDLAQQADSMAKKTGDLEMQVRAIMAVAYTKEITTDPQSGLNDFLKAEAIAENLPDKKLLANCQAGIASIYENALSNYPKAMEWLIKAVHTSEAIGYLSGLETSWQDMGNLYTELGDYQKALMYDAKALQASDSLGIKNSSLQNSLGEAYRLSGKYPEAIAAYQKAIAMDKTPYDIELYQSNIADVYVKRNDLPNAFSYALTSLSSAKKLNDLSGEAWIENILARAYLKKNMEDSALVYATKGLQAAQQSNYLEFLRDNTGTLADIYANKKDFEKAYKYHLQYIIYRDSMVNAEVSNKANLMQYDYSMAKTQAKITALNAQKKSQRNLLITAVSILALIVLISILLLRNNRQKQKANKLLQQQKQEIDAKAQNVELLSEIGRKITASLSVEKIIGTVYDNVNSLMDANVFGIGIYNDALKRIDFPATYEKGAPLPFYSNSIDDQNRFGTVCFKSGKEIIINNLNDEYKEHVQEIETPDEGGTPASIIFLPLIAKGEKLGVITVQSFQKNAYSDYQLYMFRNIATYTSIAIDNAESFETLNTTFSTLKSTQTQLIQSEKMASLGELTAGIAHEIQNPLNFVNNFSEVNTELIDELEEEAKKGNIDGVKALANDIKKNEQRINHHGKRAGEIVKGMLQHSRSSTGVKEPTDINALCDEYVRLAYHGLKAKDKSFNAKFETDFDKSIPKINIVLQDIGRVVLNLINNSFYAVSEKKKHQPGSYEPTVTVSTKKETGKILISVKDNGSGIPQKIVDKIFQPFFTTKPTGSGTGLGLSLSYDIIKAHGGEIKVESVEGEGTEFIVELPFV